MPLSQTPVTDLVRVPDNADGTSDRTIGIADRPDGSSDPANRIAHPTFPSRPIYDPETGEPYDQPEFYRNAHRRASAEVVLHERALKVAREIEAHEMEKIRCFIRMCDAEIHEARLFGLAPAELEEADEYDHDAYLEDQERAAA